MGVLSVRAYTAERWIDAPPEAVWVVLVDLAAYPSWNPFTVQVRSTLRPGEPIDLTVFMKGRWTLQQREWVEACEAPHRLVWGMWSPARWVVWARREQVLTPVDGGTRYVTTDLIGGLLGPLVHGIFGAALTWGFDAMAEALRQRVEAHHTPGSTRQRTRSV